MEGTNKAHENGEAMGLVGVSLTAQLGDTAFNANYLRRLGIHEHVAATKQGLLSVVVECVLPHRSDEHFMGCKCILML